MLKALMSLILNLFGWVLSLLLEFLQFPALPPIYLWIQYMVSTHYCRCVPTFGDLWVDGRLHLTIAFRSLPRPSSAPIAKASTLCSSLLNHS